MCKLCKRMICPPNCPNFAEKDESVAVVRCVLCGGKIHDGDGCYRMHGFPYCEDCLDFSDIETLVRICEISKREWLGRLGFTYETLSI